MLRKKTRAIYLIDQMAVPARQELELDNSLWWFSEREDSGMMLMCSWPNTCLLLFSMSLDSNVPFSLKCNVMVVLS